MPDLDGVKKRGTGTNTAACSVTRIVRALTCVFWPLDAPFMHIGDCQVVVLGLTQYA